MFPVVVVVAALVCLGSSLGPVSVPRVRRGRPRDRTVKATDSRRAGGAAMQKRGRECLRTKEEGMQAGIRIARAGSIRAIELENKFEREEEEGEEGEELGG